jgi:hypothetical protein
MRDIAVEKTSSTLFTSPGMALSGQMVKQSPQAVQFSGLYCGYLKRIWVMSRNTPLQAGITPSPINGSARFSLPWPPM